MGFKPHIVVFFTPASDKHLSCVSWDKMSELIANTCAICRKQNERTAKRSRTNLSTYAGWKSLFQSKWNLGIQRLNPSLSKLTVLLSLALVCPLTTAGLLLREYLRFVTNKMVCRKCLFNWSRFFLFFLFFFKSRNCIWWHQQFWLHSPAGMLLYLQWQNLCYRSFFFRAMPDLVTFVSFLTHCFLSYI